jgi:hypothetical protein
MVLAPLPGDSAKLSSLLFHEAWHAHQGELGFAANNSTAAHLQELRPRYLIRLEWEALNRALNSRGTVQRRHIAQALAFRQQRLARDARAANVEREQMRHEGLAAYTGASLSGAPLPLVLAELRTGASRPSLGRSFAYVSGPAWGILLDQIRPAWRRALVTGIDFPDLMPIAAAPGSRADLYRGKEILREEALADRERRARLAAALYATAEKRALRLPLVKMGMNFDPDRVGAGPDGSSLYEKIELSDQWGTIKIDGVPLRITPDFSAAFARWPLTAPDHLELSPDWQVEELREGGAKLIRRLSEEIR